jgi:5-formyltetrahydrofolate cyclo-ligase
VGAAAIHPDGVADEKSALRARLLRVRPVGVPVDAGTLLALPELRAARVVASYAPLRGEPDVRPVNEALLERGLRVVLPEVLPDRDLRFGDGSGGVADADIDVMLVPALAADRSGRRLGRGGGSYDRVLPRLRAFTVAIVHADELLPRVPVEPHDARVDAVLAGTVLLRV